MPKRKTECQLCGDEISDATAKSNDGLCPDCMKAGGKAYTDLLKTFEEASKCTSPGQVMRLFNPDVSDETVKKADACAKAMDDLQKGKNIEQALRTMNPGAHITRKMVEDYEASHKAEAKRKRTQTGEVEHPVFGKMVRTDWADLLTFREFPHLKQFGKPHARAIDGKPFIKHLNKRERKLVDDWKNPTSKLVAICRNGAVHASLHYLGVFETNVDVPDDGLPTEAQENAFRDFVANEKKISNTIIKALLRYYDYTRKEMPDWFDYLDPEEKPNKPTVAQFTRLIEFDGMTVFSGSAKGVAPLLFGWKPIWALERGLSTLVYKRQVIAIDPDASDLLNDDPKAAFKNMEKYGWGRPQMTSDEKSALKEFASSFRP